MYEAVASRQMLCSRLMEKQRWSARGMRCVEGGSAHSVAEELV